MEININNNDRNGWLPHEGKAQLACNLMLPQCTDVIGLLKANKSDFLLSQYVRKILLHQFCCSFQMRAILSYRLVTVERLLAAEKVRLSASGTTCIL